MTRGTTQSVAESVASEVPLGAHTKMLFPLENNGSQHALPLHNNARQGAYATTGGPRNVPSFS